MQKQNQLWLGIRKRRLKNSNFLLPFPILLKLLANLGHIMTNHYQKKNRLSNATKWSKTQKSVIYNIRPIWASKWSYWSPEFISGYFWSLRWRHGRIMTSLFENFIICGSIFSELGTDMNKRFFATCPSWVQLYRKIIVFFGNGRSCDHHVTKSDNRKSRFSWRKYQIWVSKWSQWSREFISGHFRFLSCIGPEFEAGQKHFFYRTILWHFITFRPI